MIQDSKNPSAQLATEPHVAAAAFVQAWENVRHIRNERIWFTNAYTAIIAGGLALLQRLGDSSNRLLTSAGLVVLMLFSLASIMSSIRLIAELRNSIANLQHVVAANGMGPLVGMIEPPHGIAASLPMRWVFPIFFSLTTAALLLLLVFHLCQ